MIGAAQGELDKFHGCQEWDWSLGSWCTGVREEGSPIKDQSNMICVNTEKI